MAARAPMRVRIGIVLEKGRQVEGYYENKW